MKKIALDLDGVVFDSEELYRVYTEIYDVEKYKKDTVIDNSQKLFQKRYAWNEDDFQYFYDEFAPIILGTSNLMPGADIVIKKLRKKFHLIIVTARNDSEIKISLKELESLGFTNDDIFGNEHHKIDRLISEQVDYIIDDSDTICGEAAKNNICALHFKSNAAKELNEKNVVNVNNWGEIYKYFYLNENK